MAAEIDPRMILAACFSIFASICVASAFNARRCGARPRGDGRIRSVARDDGARVEAVVDAAADDMAAELGRCAVGHAGEVGIGQRVGDVAEIVVEVFALDRPAAVEREFGAAAALFRDVEGCRRPVDGGGLAR